MGVYVGFTSGELARLRELAPERSKNARANGTRNNRWTEHPDVEIDYAGLIGEYAVARYFGLPFRPEVQRSDKGRGDLILPNGRSAEVKFTKFPGGDFILAGNSLDGFRADVGILVHSKPRPRYGEPGAGLYTWDNPVIIAGWVTRDVFGIFCETKDYGYGPRLMLPASKLAPIEALLTAPGGHYGL